MARFGATEDERMRGEGGWFQAVVPGETRDEVEAWCREELNHPFRVAESPEPGREHQWRIWCQDREDRDAAVECCGGRVATGRKYEVVLVLETSDIETATVVVEGEDEEHARELAVQFASEYDADLWEHVKRRSEDVEAESAKPVPPDTPLTPRDGDEE